MAIIKCKMCGGDLELIPGQSVAECEYCGSRQTVPAADNDKKMTLFARANRLRAACEFDKAAGVYESIVAEFPEEAEAYWGLVLCKYGIEYVDDPATGKKIPTCHRSSFDSILEDSDFEQAQENADVVARKQYREEAKQIEEIRKGIVAVSANEQPYDIFICYKETDENGERTLDSVLAQDIYDALTAKNYRVFFSRITLEDKLGLEYEPYIFAALNSAKIMLAVGTDYEYYNAVWVKNEWSRYLKLMAKDKDKHLIPCYKGIDAYDMPKEFARLQAQDLGKVGAIQDLLRGVEKILPKSQPNVVVQEKVVVHTENAAVEPLLKRAFMFLEDCDWKAADEYCEKVLDLDPENAQAYVGKLLAECHAPSLRPLGFITKADTDNKYFQKAMRYGDDAFKAMLLEFVENSHNARLRISLKSAEEYLSKKSWRLANSVCTKILNIEPEHAKAQLYQLMASLEVSTLEDLSKTKEPLSECTPFQNALRWADDDLKESLMNCLDAQKQFFEDLKAEAERFKQVIIAHQERQLERMISGIYFTAGLRSDGTVLAVGYNGDGQCNVSDWKDIIAVSAGDDHTIGLQADGTVLAVGYNKDGRCNVSDWKDIIAISAGEGHTIGLRADGTVLAVGYNNCGQCNVSDWRDIISVSAGDCLTIGLRTDGTVVAVGHDRFGECNVADWRKIIDVATGAGHTVGLRADGTVLAVGDNEDGQCNVSDWKDIIAVSAGCGYTIGLRADGTVLAVGYNKDGRCNVSDWRNIAMPQSYADFVKKMQAQMAEHKAQREAERKAIAAEINAKTAENNNLQGQLQKQEAIYTANAKKLFGEGAKLKKSAWAEIERLKAQIAELEMEIAELRGDKT